LIEIFNEIILLFEMNLRSFNSSSKAVVSSSFEFLWLSSKFSMNLCSNWHFGLIFRQQVYLQMVQLFGLNFLFLLG